MTTQNEPKSLSGIKSIQIVLVVALFSTGVVSFTFTMQPILAQTDADIFLNGFLEGYCPTHQNSKLCNAHLLPMPPQPPELTYCAIHFNDDPRCGGVVVVKKPLPHCIEFPEDCFFPGPIRTQPTCLSCPPVDMSTLKVNESILVSPLPGGQVLLSKVLNENIPERLQMNITNSSFVMNNTR